MSKKIDERIPRYADLIIPAFIALLKDLGSSGSNDEILTSVIANLHLPDEVVDFPHKGSTSLFELAYQLAWARTYLKNMVSLKTVPMPFGLSVQNLLRKALLTQNTLYRLFDGSRDSSNGKRCSRG